MARWNKVNYEDLKNIVDKRMASTEQNTQKVDDKAMTTENTQQGKLAVEKYSFVTILRNRRIFLISLIIWFTWYVQILEKVVVWKNISLWVKGNIKMLAIEGQIKKGFVKTDAIFPDQLRFLQLCLH